MVCKFCFRIDFTAFPLENQDKLAVECPTQWRPAEAAVASRLWSRWWPVVVLFPNVYLLLLSAGWTKPQQDLRLTMGRVWSHLFSSKSTVQNLFSMPFLHRPCTAALCLMRFCWQRPRQTQKCLHAASNFLRAEKRFCVWVSSKLPCRENKQWNVE